MSVPPYRFRLLGLGLLVSGGLHAASFLTLPSLWASFQADPLGEEAPIAIDVLEPEPEPEPEPEAPLEELIPPDPDPPPPPPPVEPVLTQPPPRRRPPIPTPSPSTEPPPPQVEEAPESPEPVRFDNTTLTNENGTWQIAPGSGRERDGPIAPPTVTPGRGSDEGIENGPGRAETATNHSRRPGQPRGLRRALERIYRTMPQWADELEGTAALQLRIGADGMPAVVAITSESGPGFGAACREAVLSAGTWEPGLDASGAPVARVIPRFPCRFRQR